ncbi:MAG: hypothetical protein GX033_06115 [Firmicutes bacterium]|nr:hypothetical protein [Bacillota bacterium]
MEPSVRRVVELKDYPGTGLGLLPAIRKAVQEVQPPAGNQQLWDIGISRQGQRIYVHLFYKALE